MIRTANRFLNPVLWGLFAWLLAVIGNVIGNDLAHYWQPMVHLDEVLIALAIGALRFIHGEWRFQQIYASRRMEVKVRNALQVLRHSSNDAAKAQAVSAIIQAFDDHRPMHPDFDLELNKMSD